MAESMEQLEAEIESMELAHKLMKKRCKLGMCQLLTNLGSTMSKTMKIEEARAKLCAIVTRAHTIGIDSNRIMRLASAKKLYHPSSNRWLVLLMLLPLLITLAWFGVSLYKDLKNKVHSPTQCMIQVPDTLHRIFRPPVSCSVCANLSKVDKIAGITVTDFEERYAYSGRPVVVTDATSNWTALREFSFEFFRSLYKKRLDLLMKQKCQFFPYKTEFQHLGEFLNLTEHSVNWTVPWYVGWSNCDVEITEVLRKHYQRPYFLPPDAEAKRLDWIFMGSKGFGAPIHVDNVEYPSWQAQLQGRKKWQLQPAPECFYLCSFLQVIVEPGEIIVLDTNRWFHSTEIVSDENSITIGAEFD